MLKIIFVGNRISGDDGIGPRLHDELKDEIKAECLDLGVIGLDIISYINEEDELIIVDAVHYPEDVGAIITFGENELAVNEHLVSQHDFGIEQTASVIRAHYPKLKPMKFIGVKIASADSFTENLSEELEGKIPKIKKGVLKLIMDS